jgi:hypothetical protein
LSTEFNTQYHTQKKDIFSKQRFLLWKRIYPHLNITWSYR